MCEPSDYVFHVLAGSILAASVVEHYIFEFGALMACAQRRCLHCPEGPQNLRVLPVQGG